MHSSCFFLSYPYHSLPFVVGLFKRKIIISREKKIINFFSIFQPYAVPCATVSSVMEPGDVSSSSVISPFTYVICENHMAFAQLQKKAQPDHGFCCMLWGSTHKLQSQANLCRILIPLLFSWVNLTKYHISQNLQHHGKDLQSFYLLPRKKSLC